MTHSHHFKQLLSSMGAVLLVIQLLSTSVVVASELETKVKAAYLYHLTQFVEWPKLPEDHMNICVLGNDPVGDMLLGLSHRNIKSRILNIEIRENMDTANCHVLFISQSESAWKDVLIGMRQQSVLTVSDIHDFATAGGIIGFYLEEGKIKLEINPSAVNKTNLKISSKLMELARHVQ